MLVILAIVLVIILVNVILAIVLVIILVSVILVIVLIMDVISRCSGSGYNYSQCNSSHCSDFGCN